SDTSLRSCRSRRSRQQSSPSARVRTGIPPSPMPAQESVMRPAHRAFMLTVAGFAACITPDASRGASGPDLDGLTAQQAAADLCASKITSTALVSAAIARAKASANLNAFITLDEAGAMKAAAAFDAGHRKRSACKPLGGVPIVIKDNIEVAGLP